ncbi:hypothetical protein [Candidatus Regiella insecticola]|nr:hypothetical protein [Candidatus Regiella insecticola]
MSVDILGDSAITRSQRCRNFKGEGYSRISLIRFKAKEHRQ